MIHKNIKAYRFSDSELFFLLKLFKIYGEKVNFESRLPEVYIGNFEDFIDVQTEDFIDVQTNDFIDFERKLSNPDFLGFYMYESDNEKEGKIYLYDDRIKHFSSNYSEKFKIDYNYSYNLILFIVLFHELGHWIHHWILKDENDKKSKIYNSFNLVTIETFAQLNLLYAIKGINTSFVYDLKKMFFYLVEYLPFEYQQFLKCKTTVDVHNFFSPSKIILNRYIKLQKNTKFHYDFDHFYFILTGKK